MRLTSASNHPASSSSPTSIPSIPPKHPLTTTCTHPSVLLTIPGFASLRLIINSSAAFLTSSASRSCASSSPCGERCEEEETGGKVKEEGEGEGEEEEEGKGRATVGVGPGSALGRMRFGSQRRRAGRWGAKRVGEEVARGVRVLMNL